MQFAIDGGITRANPPGLLPHLGRTANFYTRFWTSFGALSYWRFLQERSHLYAKRNHFVLVAGAGWSNMRKFIKRFPCAALTVECNIKKYF